MYIYYLLNYTTLCVYTALFSERLICQKYEVYVIYANSFADLIKDVSDHKISYFLLKRLLCGGWYGQIMTFSNFWNVAKGIAPALLSGIRSVGAPCLETTGLISYLWHNAAWKDLGTMYHGDEYRISPVSEFLDNRKYFAKTRCVLADMDIKLCVMKAVIILWSHLRNRVWLLISVFLQFFRSIR